MVCLTFRRNHRILIEMKTLEMNSRKNRDQAKPQVPEIAKLKGTEERTTML